MMNVKHTKIRSIVGVAGAAFLMLGLAGCGALQMQSTGIGTGDPSAIGALQGMAHGGQQPLIGSVIQLYAVGTGGYGTAATPLLPTSGANVVTTSDGSGIGGNASNGSNTLAAGSFTITHDYTCPSNSYVYLTVTGGNPQTGGAVNPDIELMAALGSCTDLQTNLPFISINEVTTVAAVWALQQFISITPGTAGAFNVSTSATNMQGLINAFGVANILANTATGSSTATTTNATGTAAVEYWQVNTVADILATCVNSDPATNAANCTALFTDAKVGSTTPADTLQAAWLMAQNPGNNVQALFGLATANAPFANSDDFVNDWTIGFSISTTDGVNLASPYWIAFDSYGNSWVTSNYNDATSGGFVTEFDPQGNLISKITSYNLGTTVSPNVVTIPIQAHPPFDVAIDLANNAWVADRTGGAVFRVGASGSAGGANGGGGAAAFGISTGSSSNPSAIVVDGNGTVWTTLQGSTISSTFAAANAQGLAGITPSLPTGGPLTGGFMGTNPTGAAAKTTYSTSSYAMVVDATSASTYAAGPFISVINNQVTCGTPKYGTINSFFAGSGTVTGSSSNTTVTQGETTPANILADSGVSCAEAGATLSTVSTTYGGNAYTVPALYTPYGAAVDGNNNIWVMNTAIVSTPTGYPVSGLTKLTPSYSTDPTTGALNLSYTPTVTTGGGLPTFSSPQYVAVDGANNIWMDTQATTPLSSFAEYSSTANSGVGAWLSPNTATSITSTKTANGWFGGDLGNGAHQRISQSRRGLAIDGSGNVWAVNNSSSGATIGVLVGAAVPAVTPISLALKNSAVGTRP